MIGQPCLTYQVTKNAQGAIQSIPVLSSANLSGGLLGTTTGLIGSLFANPPVRTSDYLASIGHDLGIKEAHAQVIGSGASVLSPVIKLWTVSRNISYIFMIIIFLVIGLMVMFRQRINPQTVITAQAALPGLVIGLIMITFSFFFAGLISDIAFVGTNIVGYYFTAAQEIPPQNLVKDMSSKNVVSIFTPFTKAVSGEKIKLFIASIWDDLSIPNTGPKDMDPQKALTLLTSFILFQITSPFGSLVPGWGQAVSGLVSVVGGLTDASGIAGFVLSFIAMIVLIYAMFRLLLRLVNAYLTIIFLTFTAPFQFLFASLPGRQGIATSWILNMLANILAFPAVLAVLYFVAFLLGSTYTNSCMSSCVFNITEINQAPNAAFISPVYAQDYHIVGKQAFPLFGNFDLDFIEMLLAFGALVALPSIPDIINRSIGRLGVTGQLIGQEISSSVSGGRGYAGQFQQGIGSAAGQIGRVTDEPGWTLTPTGWERVTPTSGHSAEQIRLSGARPGLGTRIIQRFRR